MRDPDGEDWTSIGQHRFRLVPPDIFQIIVNGDVSAEVVQTIYSAMIMHATTATPLVLLADVSRMGALPSAARKAAVESEKLPIDAMVMVGTSRPIRLIIQLISRGYELLSRDASPAKLCFAGTDAEAQRWIEHHRRSRDRLTRPPGGAAPPPDRSR